MQGLLQLGKRSLPRKCANRSAASTPAIFAPRLGRGSQILELGGSLLARDSCVSRVALPRLPSRGDDNGGGLSFTIVHGAGVCGNETVNSRQVCKHQADSKCSHFWYRQSKRTRNHSHADMHSQVVSAELRCQCRVPHKEGY